MRQGLARRAAPRNLAAKATTKTVLAPTRGKVSNENVAAARRGGARVLTNGFPEQSGIRIRGGSERHATLGTVPIESLFTFVTASANRLIAADATKIFNITTVADPEVAPTPDVTGQTSGYYSTQQFGTTGGDYLYIVNGADTALLYDGTTFQPITAEVTKGLAYDAQSANFTVGQTVTGGTSGATATIVDDDDDGATGTLHIQSVTGTFQDNETITDAITGSATSNIPSGVTTINGVVITGVTTSALSQVFSYRNRLYFVEGDTKTVWYLPVDAVGGAATALRLDGELKRGGSLLFGATWSLDAGDGVDDKMVLVSTEGELLVFEGTDPGNADWRRIGRYDTTKPLGKNATMVAGGDLLIATVEGIVPVSEAVTKDVAALSLSAVTRSIEPDWRDHVALRDTKPWEMIKWPEKNMGIVTLPVIDATTPAQCLVVNLETGAWADYSNWDTRSLAVHNGQAYFGSSDGKVYAAEVGGTDDGVAYEVQVCPLFSDFRTPGVTKHCRLARAVFLASTGFVPKVSVSFDYSVAFPSPPNAFTIGDGVGVWDAGTWDNVVWSGAGQRSVSMKWSSVSGAGFALAPQLQITISSATAPDIEFSAMHLLYEIGDVVS